ncbi:tryptophan synthase subunit alpha [Celerinatantimonas yamalensis]|uniref:Tryptophan synthase alpha chain n=1 Tax=Celerinatantimonas yamalensis TaxID=559956 RepID=A0ABW9G2C5_9GAMM
MSRYLQMFDRLNHANEGAFVPFVTLGDPSYEQSLAVVDALVAGGADALELGFPFSDPVADGPTIQGANIRALTAGAKPSLCIKMLADIRRRYPDLPIGLLLYANLVYSTGVDSFYHQLSDAGVDSVLIADVPTIEASSFRDVANRYQIDSIFIAPPNADDATLATIAEMGSGYTYLVSRAGVTGAETKAGTPVEHLLDILKKHNAPPALLGFGISQPEQVSAAIAAGAAGAISGSAVVKIIADHLDNPTLMCEALKQFTQRMKAATARN